MRVVAARGDRAFREFIAELFAAAAGMQSLRRAIARTAGLGSTELTILLAIWRLPRPGHIGIKGLAEHLHVASPHVTDEVTRLVQIGLLDKAVNPRDLRAVSLTLSKRGRAALESLASRLEQINKLLFAGISARDMRIVRRFLQRLIEQSGPSIKEAVRR